MKAKCKYGGHKTTWPCPARHCPLFFDCLTEYEKITAKPMTNADRIRAMSDKEMEEQFVPMFEEWSCQEKLSLKVQG